MDELSIIKKELAREKAARKQAEAIMEAKARELYEANLSLSTFNASLEEEIQDRTRMLMAKEQQYKVLINNATDIIFTTDDEGYFLMMNPISLKKFGYCKEDIIGARYVDFVHEDYREEVFAFYTKIKEDNIEKSYLEFPVITASGDTIWVGQSVTKLTEGDRVYFSAVARDITEKVNNLKALKTVNSRFSALLENLIDGILVEDENRKVVLVNQAFTKMFKIPLTPDEMVGLDCKSLAIEAANYFVDETGFLTRIEDILNESKIVVDEEISAKDGRVFTRNFIPIQIDGQNHGTLWYYSDITKRRNQELILKRSEEKYRGILENMELGIMEVDTDDNIVRVYDRFNEMTGYNGDELIGRKARETFPVDDYISLLKEQDESRLHGASGVYEMKIRRKDQSEIWVLISGAPFYDENGKVAGSIGLHYDITSRKRLEQALKVAREEAINAQQAEKQFLASMSHEIRTPLNAIIGMTHLLEDTKLGQDQVEYLEVLASSASLLKNLISDILDISKIDAGTIDLQKKPVDIKQKVQQLLQTVRIKGRDKNLEFCLNWDEAIHHSVLSDGQLLSQIWLNLLSNAEKFTATGSISFTVKLLAETNDLYRLYFEVKDTGIGMDESEVDLIFEQFTQANPEIRDKFGGTGLGLPISKRLVGLLGGDLKVKSQKGKGSTFYFSLELKKGPLLEDLKINTSATENHQQRFNGKQALIVEDNPMNIKYLTILLKKWGIRFVLAKNGKEAIAKYQEQPFDIVFMDLQMPVMDGYKASQKIRSLEEPGKQVPIIALTASTFLSKKQLALKAGLSDFVSKPFTPNQLYEVTAKYLNGKAITNNEAMGLTFSEELDQVYLKKIYANDLAYAHDMFTTFVQTIDREVAHLRSVLKGGDTKQLKRITHKMKPTFAMVGLTNLTDEFGKLEIMIEQLPLVEIAKKIDQMLLSLDQSLPLIVAEEKRLHLQLKTR